jgi:farnesol dehydrogenase
MSTLAAVTGGTGFIGGALVRRLLADGNRVRLLVRRNTSNVQPVAGSIELVHGDIRDADAVRAALDGAQTVYHLAGCAKAWASEPGEFEAVNVTGTRHVLAAARATGVHRVVHVSTSLADAPETALLTEYQRSKRAAETVVDEHVRTGGDAVVVRPTRVYGPGPLCQSNSVTRAIALYRRGVLRVRLADADVRANYVFVDDVVDGLLAAAARGRAGAQYTLAGANATFVELLETVGRVVGRVRRTLPLPDPAARSVAVVSEWLARLGLEPLITRDWLDLLRCDWPVAADPDAARVGFTARSLEDGVRTTVAWLAAGRPLTPLTDLAEPRAA